MSSTNKTTYFELPLFIGTDTPSWLGDWNSAMTDIDTSINVVKTSAESAMNRANSASGKADANTKTINLQAAEIKTLKDAVLNYDNILNFKLLAVAKNPNNIYNNGESGDVLIAQNTNKTLSAVKFRLPFSDMSNPTTFNCVGTTSKFVDLFTLEDNAFNLQATSQPNITGGANSTMWVGPVSWYDTSTFKGLLNLHAWFDGTTTHFGVLSSNPSGLANTTIFGVYPVFLSGSVYNPTDD